MTENHYLSGNFGPVADELTAFDLPVTGTIPAELEGRWLRNGFSSVRVWLTPRQIPQPWLRTSAFPTPVTAGRGKSEHTTSRRKRWSSRFLNTLLGC